MSESDQYSAGGCRLPSLSHGEPPLRKNERVGPTYGRPAAHPYKGAREARQNVFRPSNSRRLRPDG